MAFWLPKEERLRREASAWFARLDADDGDRYRFAFRAWLSRDPRHGHAYESVLARWDSAELLRFRESIENSAPIAAAKPAFARRWLAPVVTVAAVAIGVAAVALWAAHDANLARGGVATAVAQRRTVALGDGSLVTLDADSIIVPRFSDRRRLVQLLRGRARFKVAHAPGRPFVVAAGETLVTAHGTIFDVDFLDRGRVDVALLQGVVDVSRARALGLLHPVSVAQLSGVETARLDRGAVRVAAPGLGLTGGDWTTGQLNFEQAPLSEVLADANRYGARQIRLASPDLDALEITGVFHAGVAAKMAASLALSLGLRVSSLPNGDLLLSRPSA